MTTTKRTYGAEFEAKGITKERATQAILDSGVACQNHGHTHNGPALMDSWKIVYDSSVHGGFEAVTPPLRDTAPIRTALRALVQAGARVDSGTGFHVHVDARGMGLREWKRLAKIWVRIEKAVDGLIARSRRGSSNTYCRSNRGNGPATIEEWDRKIDACTTGRKVARTLAYNRYYKLNPDAFTVHGTVEFRAHQGTLNATKAINWILFCVEIVEKACGRGPVPEARDLDLSAVLDFVFSAPARKTPKPSTKATTQRYRTWKLFEAWHTMYSASELKTRVAETTGINRPVVVREHVAWKQWKNPESQPAAEYTEVRQWFQERALELA